MGGILGDGRPHHIDHFQPNLGGVFGYSDWLKVDQGRIDEFGHATHDMNRIHVDPEFARKHSPTAGTELPAAAEQAFMIPTAMIAAAQAKGEVAAGDVASVGFAAFAAMQGLVTFVSSGFTPAEMAEELLPGMVGALLDGLRPR